MKAFAAMVKNCRMVNSRLAYDANGRLPTVNWSTRRNDGHIIEMESQPALCVQTKLRFTPSPARWCSTRVVQFGHRRAEFAGGGFDDQFVAADPADLNRRNTHQFRALDHFHRVQRLAGDDDARLRFAKEQGVQSHCSRVS